MYRHYHNTYIILLYCTVLEVDKRWRNGGPLYNIILKIYRERPPRWFKLQRHKFRSPHVITQFSPVFWAQECSQWGGSRGGAANRQISRLSHAVSLDSTGGQLKVLEGACNGQREGFGKSFWRWTDYKLSRSNNILYI